LKLAEWKRAALLAASPLALLPYFLLRTTPALLLSAALLALVVAYALVLPLYRAKFPKAVVDLDFVYLVLHMLSVSTGKPPTSLLFKCVSEDSSYQPYREAFRKIYLLGKEWGYSFAEACRLVSKAVYNKIVQEFLARLSSVLSVGEDVEHFLRLEYGTMLSEYETQYTRATDALRVVLGVYTSLLASASFMVASLVMLALFFGGASANLIVVSFLAVTLMVVGSAVSVSALVKKEPFENKLKPLPGVYLAADALAALALALGALASYFAAKKVGASFIVPVALFGVSGALLLLPGYLAKSVEKLVSEIDDFFPVFVRSYGMHLQTIPHMAKALKPTLAAELGRLSALLKNLYARLVNGVDPSVAWRLFSAEARSELVARDVKILLDAFERGGRLADVGAWLSDHHNAIVRLRRSRLEVGRTFETTSYVMTFLLAMIISFVSYLAETFSTLLTAMQVQLPASVGLAFFFGAVPHALLVYLATALLAASVLSTAAVASRAVPGVSRSFWYYVSVLSLCAAAGVLVGDRVVGFLASKVLGSLSGLFG